MQETKKNPVEEALIQMKNVEEAIAENAKGILASTMKEEINQLVKESLSEQDDEVDLDAEIDLDDTDVDTDVDTEMDFDADNVDDMDIDLDMDSEETPIDLTDASDEEILKVFKAMGEEDGIIVKKDGEDVHLKDNDADVEYLVKLGESKEKSKTKKMKIKEEMDLNFDDSMDSQDQSAEEVMNAIFGEMEETEDMEEEFGSKKHEFKRHGGHKMGDVDGHYKDYEMDEEDDMDEVVYEIEFNESDDEDEMMESDEDEMMESDEDEMMESDEDEMMESDEDEMMESDEDEMMESDDDLEESYNPQNVREGKKLSMKKPKGVGIGSGPKFSYKSSEKGGFKEDKKEGPKTMGTGKAKFDYKKGENMEGKSKVVKKAETKEAARTYGNGSKSGRGLRKGISDNRNYVYGKGNVHSESLEAEVKMLREKNEEYRKALNVFREKLTEVAIFNSNLAYATRLFTEHSTTKKEKINILRRFDDVETLKESKNLYKSLKDELGKTETKTVNESVEKTINNTISSGSATTLIESKTYENPQFLRMKDLMTKIK
jgi:hypothetical protein